MRKMAIEGEREGKGRLMVKSMFESDCLGVNHFAPYFTICQTRQQLKPSLYGLLWGLHKLTNVKHLDQSLDLGSDK